MIANQRTDVARLAAPPVAAGPDRAGGPLHLPAGDFRWLFARLGPSLGLWRAAEIAALREHSYPGPILDLGCGDGLVTSAVLPRVDVGLDPDVAALARAARLGLYAALEPAPAQHSRQPAGSLGSVISNSVLEHIGPIDEVLAAVARLLRPGGRLIFTVPAPAFNRWLALPLPAYAAARNRHFVHRNIWGPETWAAHLTRTGFEVETVRPYLRHTLVTAWDWLELAQQIRVGGRRAFGLLWRRLPPAALDRLARAAAGLDLAAGEAGGGQLIAARRL